MKLAVLWLMMKTRLLLVFTQIKNGAVMVVALDRRRLRLLVLGNLKNADMEDVLLLRTREDYV